MSGKLRKTKKQKEITKKLVRVSLIVVRCQLKCYSLQVFSPEGDFRQPEAVRAYLRDQQCQHCGGSFGAMFAEDIEKTTKTIAFLESIFGEIILKNNFIHYLNNQ